jgi:protein-L-isoaspartate(D-aspartate) O-methyltransferase
LLVRAAGLLAAWTSTALGGAPSDAQGFARARDRMVDEEIVAAGVKEPRVVRALRDTPRHEFVPVAQRERAYFDMALPIGQGQTISPPFVVAYMTEQLDPQPQDKVLEIGTGSGYQAAVLSPLVKDVFTIEIVRPLGETATRTLQRLGYKNVRTRIGDGYQGWPEEAPFDKIIVTCSPEQVPARLVEQLREGGRMIVPVGERYQQTLYLFRKQQGQLVSEALLPTLFVPMTGLAEAGRKVQPDPLRPQLVNSGFEELLAGAEAAAPALPAGWHYQRQLELVEADDAPQGRRYLTFRNQEPGRNSHALQGLAVDGRQVTELELTAQVRAVNVQPGQTKDQLAAIVLTFYDERRAQVGRTWLGPWRGSFEWQRETESLRVPPRAREAILTIGLLGAVGELSLDEVVLQAVPRK